ncbi:type VI secretion system lipoprotein TssJ [Paraburkholderia bryophila]|uniref:type VI secretion system lipoprotein TssJ n=1 Tax=Burkholderiaceae TaxID=119060 RepID=UPI0005513DB7|nr:type VI secretion system lipoprotein TssJ [Burkholderia sp. 9120]
MFLRPIVTGFVSIAMLSSCGAWQAVSETGTGVYRAVFYRQIKTVDVDFVARASINPDEANRPCSVSVRVYQLKDRKRFDAASYSDLLTNDKTLLAQDLRASAAAVVNPGGAVSLSEPVQTDTRYVAIVVFYREPSPNGQWRTVIPRKKLSTDKPLKLELIDRTLVAQSQSQSDPEKTKTD